MSCSVELWSVLQPNVSEFYKSFVICCGYYVNFLNYYAMCWLLHSRLACMECTSFFFYLSCRGMMSVFIHQSVGTNLGCVYNFTTMGVDFLICSRVCWTHAQTLMHCGICSQYNLYYKKLWNIFLISISMDCITISKKTVIELCCQFHKPHSSF